MNEEDRFESDLRGVSPAPPPPELLSRLRRAPFSAQRSWRSPQARGNPPLRWRWVRLGWALAATAVVVLGAVRGLIRPSPRQHAASPAATLPALRADDVQIDRELVGSFDAVARLPTGEPIRFRCRRWVDLVVLEDKQRGLLIEQRSPRVEVIPVRFETY